MLPSTFLRLPPLVHLQYRALSVATRSHKSYRLNGPFVHRDKMDSKPGILYVTMQPHADLPTQKFHDWYNNEHGPMRVRMPFFKNGFRYRATDLSGSGKDLPEWMAIYDVTDMNELVKEPYVSIRAPPIQSQRERDNMKQITVNRKFYDLVSTSAAEDFGLLEDVKEEGSGNVMVAVFFTIKEPGLRRKLDEWYENEHVPLLSKIPGWLRTRRFVSSSIEDVGEMEFFALHEYKPKNGLNGPEWKTAVSTPGMTDMTENVVKSMRRRVYDLYYTFGPVARDVSSVHASNTSTDGKTRELLAKTGGSIESYVTTKDGVVLPTKLDGCTDTDAPLIILCNSVLTEWGIWDGFVAEFLAKPQNKKYRILRYHTRGRSSECGDSDITLDILASDVVALLDAYRIPKAAAVMGVSLGGATALCTAMRYPSRVSTYISCDTSAKSPEGNSKAWGERLAVSKKEAATAVQTQEPIVGNELAELTVRRWFVKQTYDGGKKEAEATRVKSMVVQNSQSGFERSVRALFTYDLTTELQKSDVKGMFVVGDGDGVLPKAMKAMSESAKHGEFVEIPNAGHLPMVEDPAAVADAVTKFLSTQA